MNSIKGTSIQQWLMVILCSFSMMVVPVHASDSQDRADLSVGLKACGNAISIIGELIGLGCSEGHYHYHSCGNFFCPHYHVYYCTRETFNKTAALWVFVGGLTGAIFGGMTGLAWARHTART